MFAETSSARDEELQIDIYLSHSKATFASLLAGNSPKRHCCANGQGDAFASLLPQAPMKRAHAPKKIAPPVDKLKLVTPYPKARATMNETTLSTLVPVGTPIVLHLYTG
eukprot:scaffold4078_cov68-Phaeocystis_antarctica.AAC.16